MGRSQESFNKKNIRNKKEKKRKDKAEKKQARKDNEKNSFDDMIAYVDAHGNITSAPPDKNKKEEIKVEDIELGARSRELDETEQVRKGVIEFFNHSKGYGFIKDLETKQNFFVHISNTSEELKEGNLVSFEIMHGPKPSAINVKKQTS